MELQLWLCLSALPAGTRVSEALASLDGMSTDERHDFNDAVQPHFTFGFHDLRVELQQLLDTHGGAITVGDLVDLE